MPKQANVHFEMNMAQETMKATTSPTVATEMTLKSRRLFLGQIVVSVRSAGALGNAKEGRYALVLHVAREDLQTLHGEGASRVGS